MIACAEALLTPVPNVPATTRPAIESTQDLAVISWLLDCYYSSEANN
jgi:hypothetical protein